MGQRLHRCAEPGCHVMVPIGQRYCGVHQRDVTRDHMADRQYDHKRKADTERAERNAFYRKPVWKQTRQAVMERDDGLCQYCELVGTTSPADMVDHIVPREIAPELSLDMNNLVAACNMHHNMKTKWEQSYYGTGQRNKINPDAVRVRDYHLLDFVFKTAENLNVGV